MCSSDLLLFISPTAMESYLGAAEKLSRLAIGDPTAPEMVNIYRMPDEQQQQTRVEDLSVGTRGGMAVRSTFPLDGEYRVKVAFAGSSKFEEKLEITVDGERMQLANVGKNGVLEDPNGRPRTRGEGRVPLEFKINVKAGPRLVGVTFIERNEIRDDEVLRPRMRGYGAQLAIDTVTITGPYNAKGAGDTPSRKRIFVCRPATPAEEEPCEIGRAHV